MNNLYFACTDCRIFVDAGYRWAYAQLQHTNIVARGQPVEVKAVLAAANFWHPPVGADSKWLYQDVFPSLREFFAAHAGHRIIFGDEEEIIPTEAEFFEWMEIGHRPTPLPRYFVEVLGLRSWDQVMGYVQSLPFSLWWWEYTRPGQLSLPDAARRKMEELLAGASPTGPERHK